jgi:cell division septum initiation protein DivIVA
MKFLLNLFAPRKLLKENEELKQKISDLQKRLLDTTEEANSAWFMLEEIKKAEEEIAAQLEKELNEIVLKSIPTVGDA